MAENVQKLNKPDQNRIPLQEVESKLKDGLGQADALRHEGLVGLSQMKRAKLVQTRRERGRVEAKYDADHRLVQQLDRQMIAEHQTMVFTRMERDKAAIEIPAREKDQFILFGHVKDEDGYPLRDYQIGLYVDTKAKAVALVDDASDECGVFHLSVPVAAVSQAETATVATHVVSIDARQQELLYLMVMNSSGKTVHKDSYPIQPVAGGLVYRDIIISEVSQAGCGCCQTQFLGNSNTRELHDLSNEKPRCYLAKMKPDHRVYFSSVKQAQQADYDFCAYCFSRQQSKR